MTTRREGLPILAGIFVGGKGERFGGAPKGLLRTSSGETLIDRWRRLFDRLGIRTVLVGAHDAYLNIGMEVLADSSTDARAEGRESSGIAHALPLPRSAASTSTISSTKGDSTDNRASLGPLGGILSLLAWSQRVVAPNDDDALVVAVACDMPFVEPALLAKLADAPLAPIVAARRGERWEPFFARYRSSEVLPVAGDLARERRTALQALFASVGARELPLDSDEASQLDDWDRPEDRIRRPS